MPIHAVVWYLELEQITYLWWGEEPQMSHAKWRDCIKEAVFILHPRRHITIETQCICAVARDQGGAE